MKPKMYKKTCKLCGKEFTSCSKKQNEWNYITHIGACKKKYVKEINGNAIASRENLSTGEKGIAEKEVAGGNS